MTSGTLKIKKRWDYIEDFLETHKIVNTFQNKKRITFWKFDVVTFGYQIL